VKVGSESPPAFIRDLVQAETPRGQLGVPDDIAEVVAFLASDTPAI
jgi:NAD(P)-dependent dehydrogenase (short-subunit alcohol dehydrogenase family)